MAGKEVIYKQFTIRLKSDMHKEFKIRCATVGRSMNEVAEELIRDWLTRVDLDQP
jgi:hypothetical protein